MRSIAALALAAFAVAFLTGGAPRKKPSHKVFVPDACGPTQDYLLFDGDGEQLAAFPPSQRPYCWPLYDYTTERAQQITGACSSNPGLRSLIVTRPPVTEPERRCLNNSDDGDQ